MARFRRSRRRRLRFRPVRRRFYIRRRSHSRRRYRRRTNTRSSSRSFGTVGEYVVSLPMAEGSTQPRSFMPIGLSLSGFPGFAEYEYTYSRVRVLSCSITVVNDQAGTQELYGGYAIAPSYDLVQSQLYTETSSLSSNASLVYRNFNLITDSGQTNPGPVGQFYGIRVGQNLYEANTSNYYRQTGSDINVSVGTNNHTGSTLYDGGRSATYVNVGPDGALSVSPTEGVKPEGEPAPADSVAEVPLSGGANTGEAVLPSATLNQISQVKRYRVKFPSTTKRSFRVRFVPYTFMSADGPVAGLDLRSMPKYFSARRWMPLQWFSTAAGKAPLVLFGPYIAPLFAPEDVTQPITLHVYYHIRLQFAGQV